MDYFLCRLYPQNAVSEEYKHKNFLLALLTALFYRLSHIKNDWDYTHNSNYYPLKILATPIPAVCLVC